MRNLPWRGFVLGFVLALAVGYWLRATPEAPPAPEAPGDLARATPEPAPALPDGPAQPAPTAAGTPIAKAGGTLTLDRASFPASGPVQVSLELPMPSADDSPRPVRLVSQPDHRILELDGAIGSGRTGATIAVDSAFLQPGTYLVEMETTEQSAMSLRRYFIVVR